MDAAPDNLGFRHPSPQLLRDRGADRSRGRQHRHPDELWAEARGPIHDIVDAESFREHVDDAHLTAVLLQRRRDVGQPDAWHRLEEARKASKLLQIHARIDQ